MKKIFIISSILFGLSVTAQIDRSIRPKAGEAPAFNIPESTVFTLDNGITVILSQNDKTPRVSFSLVMGTEPSLEKDKAGLAEFAGNMILTGTTSMSKDEIDVSIDQMGASISASSSSIYASGLSKYSGKLMEFMTHILMNANFPESEFKRLKTQSSSALSMSKTDANTMASNIVSTVNFGKKHPYGEIMTEETLNNITRDDVVAYFNQKFTPSKAYLIVVGDISIDELKNLMYSSIAKWQAKEAVDYKYENPILENGNRVIFGKKPGAVQSVIQITFPIDMVPGHKDEVKLKIMNQILGGGTFEARLMQNLREDKAFTYGCYSSLSIDRLGSYFTTSGNFRNEVSDSAVVEIIKELKGMISAPVSAEELALAKASMTGSFVRSLERPQTIANFALSIIRNKLDKDYYKNYLKMIDETTVEDIQAMAKKYLDVNNMNIVVVGNEKIASNLLAFDSDGKIEFFDAFGNPETGFKKTDVAVSTVLDNYVLMVTKSKNLKEAASKIAKIKSMTQSMTATPSGMPVTFEMTSFYKAPLNEGMEILFNGQMMQRTYFDGKSGGSASSPMAGGKIIEYTAEEVAEKAKTVGLIPELNYAKNKVEYTLLGTKSEMGQDYYVVEVNGPNSITHDYFNMTTFQKERSYTTTTEGGETSSSNVEYRDFKEVNGLLFPHEMSQVVGSMSLTVVVNSIEINKPIDDKKFQK